jgi:hypothetical protein
MTGLVAAVTGAVAIAALSTLGDFVWATWIPRPHPIYGLSHGALLFLAIGLFLGALARRPLAGAIAGALAGAAAAGSFYLLAPLFGFSSMFVSWFVVWIALGFVYAWLLRSSTGFGTVLVRGVIAALASGLAFYLISGIWRPFNPQGWDYAVHFAAWTVAYFPGFAALLISRRPLSYGF